MVAAATTPITPRILAHDKQSPQSPSAFDRAIDRATAAGLQVIGSGRFKADGRRFYLVPSQSRPLHAHVVRLVGHSLLCDCEGAAYGRVCVHVAAVHMSLAVAAERLRAAAEVQEALLRAEGAVADDELLREELRYEPGWVPHMAPGPDPDEADDTEADREAERARARIALADDDRWTLIESGRW